MAFRIDVLKPIFKEKFTDYPAIPFLATSVFYEMIKNAENQEIAFRDDKLNNLWRRDIDPLKNKYTEMNSTLNQVENRDLSNNIEGHADVFDEDNVSYGKMEYLRFLNCIVTDDPEHDATIIEYSDRLSVFIPTIEDRVYNGEEQIALSLDKDTGDLPIGYDGITHQLQVDTKKMKVTGRTSGFLPGTYKFKLSFIDKYNYKWADGTYEDKEFEWHITGIAEELEIPTTIYLWLIPLQPVRNYPSCCLSC